MKTSEILRKALARFGANGARWVKYPPALAKNPWMVNCPVTAIYRSTLSHGLRQKAWDVLRDVIGLDDHGPRAIASWNDKPRRKWAQVESAFQQAIATAERGEG